jgi:hypothetical protein
MVQALPLVKDYIITKLDLPANITVFYMLPG